MHIGRKTWHQIQEMLNAGTRLEDMELDVVYYGRVSTEKEYQLHSLEVSNEYLEKYIRSHEKWTFVRGYIDEGISGTRADKRDEFLRMIEDARQGKFSLIITKEVSRFARNTRECLNYIKLLKDNHVGIAFLNDHVVTFRDSDNFNLNIRGVIAEEESRNTSRRVSFGHSQSIRKGTVFGNGRIYGYDKTPGGLAINEKEAEMVRMVFDMYAVQKLSLHQIELKLWDMGYRNSNGRRISHVTIGHIVSNPKYKGYYCGNKVKIIDMQAKKQKFLDPSEWVMYRDETGEKVPQIVDEQIWELAFNRYTARKKQQQALRANAGKVEAAAPGWGRSPLSGKIVCRHCGAPFWRDVVSYGGSKGKEYWRCSRKKQNGAGACPSGPIYLEELEDVLKTILMEFRETLVNNAVQYTELLKQDGAFRPREPDKEISRLKAEYEELDRKREKLLDHNLNGRISDDQFAERNRKLTQEMLAVQEKIGDARQRADSRRAALQKMDLLCKRIIAFFENYNGESFDMDAAILLVDSITVHPMENRIINLDVKLNLTGDVHQASIDTAQRRSCNMVKKMIEAQERSMGGVR